MRYKELGKTGMKVSVVGLGTWAYGGVEFGAFKDEDSIDIIRRGVDRGINLIDTAPCYGWGHSEEVVGKGLKGIRDKVVLVTKFGLSPGDGGPIDDTTPAGIQNELEASLKRLDTDYFDVYMYHRPDPALRDRKKFEESLAYLKGLKNKGVIKAIGLSNFPASLMKEAMSITTIDVIEPGFSLLNRSFEAEIQLATDNKMGIITHGSLGAGMLTGTIKTLPTFAPNDARKFWYPFFKEPMFSKCVKFVEVLEDLAVKYCVPTAQVSMNWVVQHAGISAALCGSMSIGEVEENSTLGNWEISAEDLDLINSKYAEIIGKDEWIQSEAEK